MSQKIAFRHNAGEEEIIIQEILFRNGETINIPNTDVPKWANDSLLLASLANTKIILVYYGADITDLSTAINILKENLVEVNFPLDNQGRLRFVTEANSANDFLSKVSSIDQAGGFLNEKILGTDNKISLSVENPGASELLRIGIGSDVFDKTINTTDDLVEGTTNKFFSIEATQDALATALTNSSSVSFFYDDENNQITAEALSAGINHDQLFNYSANEHIDHATVNIIAGNGLTGGGDITLSRTLSLAEVGSPGTYRSVTTDVYGRVVNGTNPTTLAGYGITDAQPLDGDLTAIAAFSTTGIAVRTATDTWTARSIAAGTGLTITNGNGVSGNPTLSLTNTAVNPGTYGNANSFPTFTVDAQGRLTAAGTQSALPFADNIKANGEVQTTSSNDTLLSDMTITPAAGTYLIIAHTTSLNTTNGAINRFSLYVGGNQVSSTLQDIQVSNNRHHSWSASSIETVNGSQAIEIRWNRNSGTARCFGRYISIIRVQ